MKPTELLETLHLAERLKNNLRHSWLSGGRQESVAEHSWRAALFACLLEDEFPDLDMAKVVKMCIFHDMGEAFTGDIPAFEKTRRHEDEEARVLEEWVKSLPPPYQSSLAALFAEMEALETPEARLYKAIDKLEVVIQHDEASLSTWLPLEYEMNLTHGSAEIQFSPYLRQLKEAIDTETRRKIEVGEA